MDSGGNLGRPSVVDTEKFFQKYEAMKEDYDSLRKRYSDLIATHSATSNKLELAQEEVNRLKKLYEEALQETTTSIRERNHLKVQCTAAIRQWDSALCERNEYKDALAKVQQQHEEAMKEVNQGMARSIKSSKDIKRLTEERDAAMQEYSLIMSERDSVHRELEKLTDDLSQAKKQVKSLETQNKELLDKAQEAVKEAEISNRTRDWAFNERDKLMREMGSLRTLCESLRRERDRAVSDLAEALSESEEMKRQKNSASRQLKELRDRIELEKESRSMRFQYLSNSSSFSESRDSAIDSDMPSGHYSIKLPNVRGADHGLVLEPGVYISRIVPGSPAAKESNLNIGDRVLFINDTAIDNVQDAILALSEDIDPIMLTLSRSAFCPVSSPIHALKNNKVPINPNVSTSKISNHASTSSLKSDKSDSHMNSLSRDRRHAGSNSGNGNSTLKSHGGLRDIFRVRLARKKLSSPEVEILETLDSAIASGGAGGSASASASTQRKARRKRGSSRATSGSENNKNGTWPRAMLNRNNACSYTLPHQPGSGPENHAASGETRVSDNHYASLTPYHKKSDSSSGFYSVGGHYIPNNSASNTVSRRPSGGVKERVPLSSLPWDMAPGDPANGNNSTSVGDMNISGAQTQLQPHQKNNQDLISQQQRGKNDNDNSTLTRNRPAGFLDSVTAQGIEAGLILSQRAGRIHSVQPQHHRYSFGVFDPSNSKTGKTDPQRNSVVPTLTMSDGSSIDFSVRSGNMDILEYYMKRNIGKNQNNSSESDNLDKVVTPPSLGLPCGIGSGSSSNVLSSSPMTNTLNRFSNRPHSRYSSNHHHETIAHPLMNFQMTHPSLQMTPRSMANTLPGTNSSFSFEPKFSSSHHSHSHGQKSEQHSMPNSTGLPSTSIAMALHSNSSKLLFRNSDDLLGGHPSSPNEPSGTFPRKREPQRIRIPSNQSVTSRSSTEKFELRNSPMPTYHIERVAQIRRRRRMVLDPGNPDLGGDYGSWHGKSGELRSIRIDKSAQPLGIQITCKAKGGGVFISCVTEGSVASHANLRVGSQILEICGINMRSASYEHAAQVLQQCKDTITMLVQYAPEKYHSLPDERGSSSDGEDFQSDGGSSSSENQDDNNSSLSDNESRSSGRSGSPTPCNSPQSTLVRNSKKSSSINAKSGKTGNTSTSGTTSSKAHQAQQQQNQQTQLQQALASVTLDNSHSSHNTPSGTLTRKNTMDKGEPVKSIGIEKPRYLTLQLLKNSSNLGICLVGGNVVGIYIHSVQSDSIADRAGLRTGDQILEYNGTELREATAEEAAFELAKPLDKVNILVHYNIQRYNDIKDQPGDGFYIRALFDFPALSNDAHHAGGNPDPQTLSFFKDEILYIDNTMYNGKPGKWRAWKVDSEGHRKVWGIIPSKFKVEEDLMFKRSLGDLESDRRSSTLSRRSFFRRKSSHHTSRELASFSDFSINSYGGDGMQHGGIQQLKDESLMTSTYQRVERLDYMLFLRPVLVLGALSDLIAERLVQDFPYQFGRVPLEVMHCSGTMLEKGLAENMFVDYKRKGAHYECVTMGAIKEISAKKLYCILDVGTSGIERLQRAQMYPIVLLVKFKNPKQIREIKDLRCDKITAKAAKELYEHSLKVESEYKHLITVCVPGGTNISYLATQVKTAVEREQSKTLWVPV